MSAIAFARAGPEDEAAIRAILREVPLGGAWSVALAREPDGFGGPHLPGERQDFVIARDRVTGEAVGLCERVVRPAFVGGRVVDLPYLGALRIRRSHRHRLSILKGGFAALRDFERPGDFPQALTSITADNSPARRVLTAGLKSLPTYSPLAEFSTFAIRPRRMPRDPAIAPVTGEDLADFLRAGMARRDGAPVWTRQTLAQLKDLRFLALRRDGAIAGCIAVWDQRPTRQAILADCPPLFRRLRGPMRLASRLAGLPDIPRLDERIEQVFLSHLVTRDDDPALAVRLVRAGLGEAKDAGAAAALVGVPSAHSWRGAIRGAFRAIEYRTALYGVAWGHTAEEIRPAHLFPEVALL